MTSLRLPMGRWGANLGNHARSPIVLADVGLGMRERDSDGFLIGLPPGFRLGNPQVFESRVEANALWGMRSEPIDYRSKNKSDVEALSKGLASPQHANRFCA
jgi:hypothetical protein